MATVLANPNWPAMGFEVDFQNGPPYQPFNTRMSIDAAYRRLAVRRWGTDRGRQYELDQIQAGTLNADVHDPLEYLNPDNAASPYNTGGNQIISYRCVWVWAMWPNQPGSGNIINTGVNTDYDPSFELNPDANLGLWKVAGGTTTLAQSTAQHFDGTHALLITQSAAGAGFGTVNSFRTAPLLTYTFSAYVFPTGGCAVTIQVIDAGGTTHSATSTTTSAWQRLSITWNCVDTLEPITVYGTGTSTPTFYLDATMLEFGAVLHTFTTTGPLFYPIYWGYVERWPAQYTLAGTQVTRQLLGVDALAILSRTAISQSYDATITADNPVIYVPLTNAKPATSTGALSTGSETATITGHNIGGTPNYFIPPNGSMNWAGDQHPDGTSALSISQQNSTNPPSASTVNNDTGIDVLNASLTLDTTNGTTVEFWARPVTGAMQLGALYRAAAGLNTNFPTGVAQLDVETVNTSDQLGVAYTPDGVSYTVVGVTGSVVKWPDNQWHYFAMTLVGNILAVTYDNVETDFSITAAGRIGFNYLCHFAASTRFGDPQAQVAVGRWAVYGSDIGATKRQTHYLRGIGNLGEITGARVTRLLNIYWQGVFTAASGYLALSADFNYDPSGTNMQLDVNGQAPGGSQPRVMLDVLQEIQESERGLIYAAADPVRGVVFEDRTSRYVNQVPLWTFGENTAGGEYPYSGYVPDRDPTYTFSDADLTRPLNNNFAPIFDAATRALYGQRVLTQQVQCNTDFDLYQAGIFYTQRYANPKTRITSLVFNLAANPALYPVILSLEISQLVKVVRRNTLAGVTVSGNYYVEKISHRVDAEAGKWEVTLQVSPQFVPSAWVLGDATYGLLGTATAPIY